MPEKFRPEGEKIGGNSKETLSPLQLFQQIQELVREDAGLGELKEAKEKLEEFWNMSTEHSKSHLPQKMKRGKIEEGSPDDILLIEPDDIEILENLLESYMKKFERK